jgi:hypothetical protein
VYSDCHMRKNPEQWNLDTKQYILSIPNKYTK